MWNFLIALIFFISVSVFVVLVIKLALSRESQIPVLPFTSHDGNRAIQPRKPGNRGTKNIKAKFTSSRREGLIKKTQNVPQNSQPKKVLPRKMRLGVRRAHPDTESDKV
jgi:hypothetical protein